MLVSLLDKTYFISILPSFSNLSVELNHLSPEIALPGAKIQAIICEFSKFDWTRSVPHFNTIEIKTWILNNNWILRAGCNIDFLSVLFFDKLSWIIENCSIAMTSTSTADLRKQVGSIVSTLATAVIWHAECRRLFGSNAKTARLSGTVLNVINEGENDRNKLLLKWIGLCWMMDAKLKYCHLEVYQYNNKILVRPILKRTDRKYNLWRTLDSGQSDLTNWSTGIKKTIVNHITLWRYLSQKLGSYREKTNWLLLWCISNAIFR